MSKRIKREYLPPRTEAGIQALIFWLYADRYGWPKWVIAVVFTLCALDYIGTLALNFSSDFVHPKDL